MPKAYLFDMDGLLLDTERLYMSSFLDVVVPLGVEHADARSFYMTQIGTSWTFTKEALPEFLPAHLSASRVMNDWSAEFNARVGAGVALRPGVREVLSELSEQGAAMAVVTSTIGERARAHLHNAGLAAHFEFILGGDEVSATKPDPAPYLEAAERFGLQGRDCAAFEDSDHGIAAAIGADTHAVQVPDLRPENRPLPALGQMVAKDLKEAVQLAQQRFAAAET